MIYRIRIMKSVDGKLVFDRYATEEEIFGGDILVAPDGNVYEWVDVPVPESDPMYKFGGYTQEWKRSATHFVEWGEDVDALRARIVELEHQLENHKASADGTTHWCAECKMRDDHIAELEKSAIVWHRYPDEKPQHCGLPVSVLCYTEENDMFTAFYSVDENSFFDGDWRTNVSHWAYLPEPPREES